MSLTAIVVSTVASIGLKLLASELTTSPKQKVGDSSIPDSDYRKNIPRTYNNYRQKVNWVEPSDEKDLFYKRTRNNRQILYIKNLLGVVCQQQTDLVMIFANGIGMWNEPHPEYIAPNASNQAVGKNWIDANVTWFDGSINQIPWAAGQLDSANRALASSISASTGQSQFPNSAIGYRGITCLGLSDTDISENLKTTTFPDIDAWTRTKILYDLADTVKDICLSGGLKETDIDVSELVGQGVTGFGVMQNGESRIEAIADLAFVYKFLLAEDPEGRILFRKLERPGVSLALEWYDFIPYENGKLWKEEEETDLTDLPKTVLLDYIDPAKHFTENSITSDEYPEAKNQEQATISTKVALFESEAKELANWHLNQLWIRNKTYSFKLFLKYLGSFIKGDVIQLAQGLYVQIESINIGSDYVIEVKAVRYDLASGVTLSTVGNTELTIATGETTSVVQPEDTYTPSGEIIYGQIAMLDIPAADESHSELGFYCLSNRANSTLYLDRGEGDREELEFALASTFGACDTVLAAVGNSNLESQNLPIIDTINTLEITLTSGDLVTDLSDTAFADQARLAFVGRYESGEWLGEYICFQYADPIEPDRFSLQKLQRGLKGTEWFIDKHISGEQFFLLKGDNAYWERIIFNDSQLGKTYTGKLQVVGNQDLNVTPAVSLQLKGQSIYPYPPIDLSFSQDPQDNLVFSLAVRSRGNQRTLGESSDCFEIDLLDNTATVIRTLSGSQPIVYPQAQVALDNLDVNALDFNIYKISSLVGRGHGGIVRDLAVSGTTQTVITNSQSPADKGFKYISSDLTITAEEDGYWLLVDTDTADVNITLPQIEAVRFVVQNVGTNRINLLGNLSATDTVLRSNEAIELKNQDTVWYGLLSGRIDIPHHLIVNTDFTLSQIHHNKIISVQSATTVTVNLDESNLVNPKDFHTTIRKKGEGDVFFQVIGNAVFESIGATLSAKFTAAYIGYEGNGTWIGLGAFGLTGGEYQPIGGTGGESGVVGAERSLVYTSDGDENGVFYYLGSEGKTVAWTNPYTKGSLDIIASSQLYPDVGVETIVDREQGYFHTDIQNNPYVTFDLKSHTITLNHWTYRARQSSIYHIPSRFIISGSNDGTSFTQLADRSFSVTANNWVSQSEPDISTAYRYIRFTIPGNAYFTIGEFELYGELRDLGGST